MRERGAFPLAPITRPQILWPSERDKAPSHCGDCGARLLLRAEPSASSREEVTCLLCGRVCADLISDLTPRRLTADEWRALPGNQPQRGRPKNQSSPLGPPAPPKKPGPKPMYPDHAGRQRAHRQRDAAGLVNRTRWARDYDACIVCGKTEYRHNAHGCCMKCRDRSQESYRVTRRAGR